MGIGVVLLVVFGVLLAMVLLCMAAIWLEKKAPGEDYDERQKIARGNAYRLSFFVGAFYFLGLFFYLEISKKLDHVVFWLFVGMELQLMTFHIYCLLKRSALPFSKKPLHSAISYGLLAVLWVVNFFSWRRADSRFAMGITDNTLMQLILAVSFGALSVMYLISHFWKEKE